MATTTWTQDAGMTSDEDTNNIESYSEQAEASKDAAAASAAAAAASKTAAAASETSASASETAAETAETNAETAETNAATSAATATTKASEASTSASNASTSATAAQTAQTAAETAQAAAETAETNAETAETNAETAQTAAETAQTAAETAETNAATSETNAATSETNAATSKTNAATSASTATTRASEASTSATNAATSESNASTSETNAATSETNAATSASTATTQATAASTSATNAATSESNAATSETNAATSEANASTSETNAATSASTATTQATAASGSATAAATSETNAATSESNAATSETNAATSASNAATSESNASASETAAAASETAAAASESAAETARDAALAALDSFDDRYLGQKTSDPTVDNDGDALVAGALYFNTADDAMKVYEGSTWVAAYASLSGALLSSNNLSDLANVVAARSNLALGTAATTASTDYATAAQGSTADSAVQPNDSPTFGTVTATSFAGDGSALTGLPAGYTDADVASYLAGVSNVVVGGTVDGRDLATDGSKLDGIAAGATANVGDITGVTAGSGITGGGTSGTVTVNHADTSSQASVNNSGATVIQDVTVDTYGHVTGLGSHTLTLANLGYTGATNANYITNNNQLTNGAGYTTNVGDITGVTAGTDMTGGGASGTVTINHADTSTLSGTYGSTANGTKIDQITVDARGHVTSITTGGTGDIDGVTAGSGLSGGGTSGTPTLSHADTSTQASINNSDDTVIQDITLDTYGHVTGIGSKNLDDIFMRKSATSGLDMNNNNITDVEDIYLQDRIYHDGDTDTYMQFHNANQWRVVTGGAERLEVNNSQITSTEPVHAPSFHGDGSNLTGLGGGVPAGSVIYHSANTPPTGFVKANGAALSRTTYSDLFAAIGTTFGSGNGSTTFNVPDLRGEFIRGWDDARGIDSGRTFGSAQADAFESHNHEFKALEDGPWTTGTTIDNNAFAGGNRNAVQYYTTSTGGTETRPRNIALLACIKY